MDKACRLTEVEFIEGTANRRERLRKFLSNELDRDGQLRSTFTRAYTKGVGVVIVDLGEDGSQATWAAYDPGPTSLYVLADAYADDEEIIDFLADSMAHRAK